MQDGILISLLRESLRTNGREDVRRREAKTVFRARAGRRSRGGRGPEAERNARTTGYHRDRRASPFERNRRAWGSVRGGVARAFRGPITSGRQSLINSGVRASERAPRDSRAGPHDEAW